MSGLTRIEQDSMNAVISINRKMKNQREIDWEERRYEIARDVLAGFYSKTTEGKYSDPTELARCSVMVADALINELKGGSN